MITVFPLFEWGPHAGHPNTLKRRTAEAIPLYRGALADCERMLGADHPDTNAAREDLAALTGKPKRHRRVPAQRRLVDTPAVAPIAWFVVSLAGREHDHGIFAYA